MCRGKWLWKYGVIRIARTNPLIGSPNLLESGGVECSYSRTLNEFRWPYNGWTIALNLPWAGLSVLSS